MFEENFAQINLNNIEEEEAKHGEDTAGAKAVHLIEELKSSYLTTVIFSLAFYYHDSVNIIRKLAKKGAQFVEVNKKQLESLSTTSIKSEVICQLNSTAFQRPYSNQRIGNLSFWGLTDDLHKSINFVRGCKSFE